MRKTVITKVYNDRRSGESLFSCPKCNISNPVIKKERSKKITCPNCKNEFEISKGAKFVADIDNL